MGTGRGFYSDLVRCIGDLGHDVTVVAPTGDGEVGVRDEGGVRVLRVKTGKMFGVNRSSKVLTIFVYLECFRRLSRPILGLKNLIGWFRDAANHVGSTHQEFEAKIREQVVSDPP